MEEPLIVSTNSEHKVGSESKVGKKGKKEGFNTPAALLKYLAEGLGINEDRFNIIVPGDKAEQTVVLEGKKTHVPDIGEGGFDLDAFKAGLLQRVLNFVPEEKSKPFERTATPHDKALIGFLSSHHTYDENMQSYILELIEHLYSSSQNIYLHFYRSRSPNEGYDEFIKRRDRLVKLLLKAVIGHEIKVKTDKNVEKLYALGFAVDQYCKPHEASPDILKLGSHIQEKWADTIGHIHRCYKNDIKKCIEDKSGDPIAGLRFSMKHCIQEIAKNVWNMRKKSHSASSENTTLFHRLVAHDRGCTDFRYVFMGARPKNESMLDAEQRACPKESKLETPEGPEPLVDFETTDPKLVKITENLSKKLNAIFKEDDTSNSLISVCGIIAKHAEIQAELQVSVEILHRQRLATEHLNALHREYIQDCKEQFQETPYAAAYRIGRALAVIGVGMLVPIVLVSAMYGLHIITAESINEYSSVLGGVASVWFAVLVILARYHYSQLTEDHAYESELIRDSHEYFSQAKVLNGWREPEKESAFAAFLRG